jgi:TPR repeat protein
VAAIAALFYALAVGWVNLATAQVSKEELGQAARRGDFAASEAIASTGGAHAEAQFAQILQSLGRDAEAWVWWQRAAEHGDQWAVHVVAQQLEREGKAADAVSWLRRGAEAGDGHAQIRLGDHLRRGDGAPTNSVEALHWYSAAAGQGFASALLPRAELLAGVDGIRPDLIEAYASAIVAEIVADDSEFAQREGAEAVREALDDVLTYKERRAAWARAQELWPGLRKAWWKGLMLPTLSLIALLIAIALVGLVLLAVYVLIRGAASVVWKR